MPCFLDQGLELLAGVEGDDAPRADRDLFAGLRVATRALRLVAQLEVAETRELDRFAPLERAADLLEERLDHVLRFALVEAHLLEQEVRQLGLRQRHQDLPRPLYLRSLAEKVRASRLTRASRAASASASVMLRSVCCIATRKP